MNVVLDTNIIVSAALSSAGNPAKIIALIPEREIHKALSRGRFH
jgi:predicted nucleic acid-binding protein